MDFATGLAAGLSSEREYDAAPTPGAFRIAMYLHAPRAGAGK